MIAEELSRIPQGPAQWRSFGLTMAGAAAVLAVLLRSGKVVHPAWLLGAAAALALLGLAAPAALKHAHRAWMTLAVVLGWVSTRIILSLLFFGVVTPLAAIARLAGKRFLELGWRDGTGTDSYWVPRERPSAGVERYERQY